jgi:hypothetical protein
LHPVNAVSSFIHAIFQGIDTILHPIAALKLLPMRFFNALMRSKVLSICFLHPSAHVGNQLAAFKIEMVDMDWQSIFHCQ